MWRQLAIVSVVWVVAYLTPIGLFEFRGEEPRRVLPALEMLDRGEYLIPRIGGQPYFQKPPLINWLVAGSFMLFGTRIEWTARLPSALFILVVAVVLVTSTRSMLGAKGSMIASLSWLTNFGMLEQGQTIEIEPVYISLLALALISWLLCWQQRRSPWLMWLVPSVFLGVGLLAKGPAHLLFFYVLVGAVLWQSGRLREFLHPAHFVAIIIMWAIFAAWAVPYVMELESLRAIGAKSFWEDFYFFFSGEEVTPENWRLNFPKGLAYFLPWALLLPFVRVNKIADARQRAVIRGFAWGTVPLAMMMLLPPGSFPRYILPLLPAFCWGLGLIYANDAFEWRVAISRLQVKVSKRTVIAIVIVCAAGSAIGFPIRAATYLRNRERISPIAAKINAVMPAGERLYAIDPYFQAFLVYVHAPITYLTSVDKLPADARYVLIHTKDRPKIERSRRWRACRPRVIEWTPRYRGQSAMLFEMQAR